MQKDNISYSCSPAALIPLPNSLTLLTWHVSGSSVIYLLLERIGCLKEEKCVLKGFIFKRNPIKHKIATLNRGFVSSISWDLISPSDVLMFLGCIMMQVLLFIMTWNTKARKGGAANWLIWHKSWYFTTYGIYYSHKTPWVNERKNIANRHISIRVQNSLVLYLMEFSLIFILLLFIWVLFKRVST